MNPPPGSQQSLLLSPTGTSWIHPEGLLGHTCPPPSQLPDPTGLLDTGMTAFAVLAGVVILALLCKLVQLRWRLRATSGSDALHYCSSYHWGRYTLKHSDRTAPEAHLSVIAPPSPPLPPPPVPVSIPVLHTTPSTPVMLSGKWVKQGDGAKMPFDLELYSQIRAVRPPVPPGIRGTQVFLFEHSAL